MDKLKIEDTAFSQAFVKQVEGIKDVFGIKGSKFVSLDGNIKEIQIDRLSTDFVYEVDEDHIVHFEFQTTNKADDIYRFQLYDVYLIGRYKKPVYTYVVYTNGITKVKSELHCGFTEYRIEPIYMSDLVADDVLNDIKAKIVNGEQLTTADIVKLEFTPLMSNNMDKEEVISTAIDISTDIADKDIRLECQTILIALSAKLNVEFSNELERKMIMSPLGQKIFNEGRTKEKTEIATNLLDVLDDKTIADKVGLSIEEVIRLRQEHLVYDK